MRQRQSERDDVRWCSIFTGHVSAGLPGLNSLQSNWIKMLSCLQCKMSAFSSVFPTSYWSKSLYGIRWQGKHLITLLSQCRSCPYSEFSTMWVGRRLHIDFVYHKEVCVTILWFGVPAHPHSHHNLGLIMPSCCCNFNTYQAPCQHPQSSTLHLHSDAEANRAQRFGINTVCHQHLLTQSWN